MFQMLPSPLFNTTLSWVMRAALPLAMGCGGGEIEIFPTEDLGQRKIDQYNQRCESEMAVTRVANTQCGDCFLTAKRDPQYPYKAIHVSPGTNPWYGRDISDFLENGPCLVTCEMGTSTKIGVDYLLGAEIKSPHSLYDNYWLPPDFPKDCSITQKPMTPQDLACCY